jgi:hypothetical protein
MQTVRVKASGDRIYVSIFKLDEPTAVADISFEEAQDLIADLRDALLEVAKGRDVRPPPVKSRPLESDL